MDVKIKKESLESPIKEMNFKGKVIEVLSGDCLMIKSNNTKEHYRVFINHVKAPKINHKNPELSENYANEAKESLRK